MEVVDILSQNHTRANVPGVSKKRLLEQLSTVLSDENNSAAADAIYQQLLNRERLGSTGIGSGVAIPHCRVEGVKKITGALLKLKDKIDFDSVDGEPVDLVFALVVPDKQQDEHLEALAAVAAMLEDEKTRARLRAARSDQTLYQLATASD